MSANKDKLEWLQRRYDELEGDVDAARESGSWQALAALQRQVTAAGNELYEARESAGGTGALDELDAAEYLAQLEISAREWPAQHRQAVAAVHLELEQLPPLEALVVAYQELHGRLRLIDGGEG